MMSTPRLIPYLVCAAVGAVSMPAKAASVLFQSESFVQVGATDNRDYDEISEASLVALPQNAANSSAAMVDDRFGPGQGSAESSYDINQETGAIKFGASASITAPTSQINSRATSFVDFYVTENFAISGTGDITFRLGIEGGMSTAGSLVNPDADAFAMASFSLVDNNGGFDILGSDRFEQRVTAASGAMVDDVLEFTASITETKNYLFTMSFRAEVSAVTKGFGTSAQASSDFLNTAFLSFEADDSLTVTASDTRFLSNVGGTVPAVPLPASSVILVSGLLALFGLRRRKAVA